MRWKLAIFFAVIVGGFGGSWLKNLPGFVIIAYEKTSYEMRLWVAVAMLLVLLTLLFFIGVILRSILSSATRLKGWQGGRQWRQARKKTISGMLAFVEGRWKQAETTMVNAAKHSDTKLINYLVAAQSAQKQNSQDRRDDYLRLAHQSEPQADFAIGLTQAQLQIENEQYEHALATLNELDNRQSNHPVVLKLQYKTYKMLDDWQHIYDILPKLKKYQVLSSSKLEEVELESVENILQSSILNGELEKMKDAWSKLPGNSRKQEKNVIAYAKRLIEFEQMQEAEIIIKPLLKKASSKQEINPLLVELYGDIQSGDGNKQFSFFENWLNNHPNAPDNSYLALGKIAYHIQLWGKARYYFERALRKAPNGEAYFRMAETLTQLGDDELAADCYKKGLTFMVRPNQKEKTMALPVGADDLVSANLLPKFEMKK